MREIKSAALVVNTRSRTGQRAFAQAREGGADAIQLSVYSENFGAQRFYQRYGFEKVADIGYWVGEQRDDEFLYEVGL